MYELIRLFILIACVAVISKGDEVDMCSLKSPESVVGKHLTLVARMGFTPHGMFVLTDKCPRKIPEALVMFPHDPGAPEVGFELAEGVFAALKPYFRLTGGAATACGAIAGQFVSRRHFKADSVGTMTQGNGFGPRGDFQFAFILQNVVEIRGCP